MVGGGGRTGGSSITGNGGYTEGGLKTLQLMLVHVMLLDEVVVELEDESIGGIGRTIGGSKYGGGGSGPIIVIGGIGLPGPRHEL
jgi:hypothetical protein